MKRREFIKKTGAIGAAAVAVAGMAGKLGAAVAAPKALPSIKLGNLEVSRFILGSNPFWGYSHKGPKLDEEMKTFYTDEKIIEVLNEAAANGVTAIASPPEERWINLYKKYLDNGGALKIWIGQCHGPADQMEQEIDRAVKGGAKAIFIQGGRVEEQYGQKKLDVLRGWVERIKGHGLPSGMAAHWPEILPECEEKGFPTDFYYQCFYCVSKGETYREEERTRAVEAIKKIDKKPVVAYKILGAGRLTPDKGFEFAAEHIRRKDGVCVGIYAKDAILQIRENAILTEQLLSK